MPQRIFEVTQVTGSDRCPKQKSVGFFKDEVTALAVAASGFGFDMPGKPCPGRITRHRIYLGLEDFATDNAGFQGAQMARTREAVIAKLSTAELASLGLDPHGESIHS